MPEILKVMGQEQTLVESASRAMHDQHRRPISTTRILDHAARGSKGMAIAHDSLSCPLQVALVARTRGPCPQRRQGRSDQKGLWLHHGCDCAVIGAQRMPVGG